MEQTFVVLKPDAVQRGLVGEILARFERRGLKFVAMKMVQVSDELARQHYAVHEGKPFFDGLIQYITSAPVVAMILEGSGAIALVRNTVGVTRPAEAAPGTIRGDLACAEGVYNLIHASDSPEAAQNEIKLFFTEQEILNYQLVAAKWLYAPK